MIWLLAALMQLSAALVVDSVQPQGERWNTVVLKNASQKVITGFTCKRFNVDLEAIPIEAGKTWSVQYPAGEPFAITGVVFADGTYEGEPAKEILARREGVRQAENQTARQIRTFLQFNSVIDDSAISVLDRELEELSRIPAALTENEKVSWNEGYISTRKNARKFIKDVQPEHRLEQLRRIGGAH